jgi:signal transduction histidine kinase
MNWNLSSKGWRLLPGVFSALSMLVLLKLGWLQPIEQLGCQLLFHLRGQQAWDNRLVLITIDDASIQQMGRFPWPRQQYANLLQVLSRSNSNLVIFDLLFSEPSADDAKLAEAMGQHGQVILAQAWDAEGAPLLPVPQLQQQAVGSGHILVHQNSDGMIHRITPQINGIPTLSLVTLQAYNLIRGEVPIPDPQVDWWVNWPGSAATLQQYSFADVVQGRVDPRVFDHKIVLVGTTATGLDPLITPFDRNPPSSSMLLHAALIQNLLQQSILTPVPRPALVLLLLLGGPALSTQLTGLGWRKQALIVAGLWAGWMVLSVTLLSLNVLPSVVAPLTLVLVTGIATGFRDRLHESAQLQHQLHQLQENETLKQEFLRTASHELRAPVANIQCAITLLRLADSPQEQEEYLQILEEECQQESALINDLLDLQRLAANPQPAQLEALNLRDWLTEVAAPFQLRAASAQQQLEIRMETDCSEFWFDWLSLRRILAELLNNACKYTPASQLIEVNVQVRSGQLALTVSNSGVNLPPAELKKLFQPFYRNLDVDHRQQGGTGLGLAIVKRLVEQLQGEIRVANEVGVLMFAIRLPITQEHLALVKEV